MISVTAAILIEDKSVLVARRGPGERHAGFWEFPGGKIEPGESSEQCLIREIKEELGLEIEVVRPFVTSIHDYGDRVIELRSFLCRRTGGVLTPTVHDAVVWTAPDDLGRLNLAAADVPIVEELVRSWDLCL